MDLDKLRTAAYNLLSQEGLWEQGWRLILSNKPKMRMLFGVCEYKPKHIIINGRYADTAPEEHVLDTLAHEVAHAVAGYENAHNAVWRAVAVRLGATPKACAPNEGLLKGRFSANCPHCKQLYIRASVPVRLLICGKPPCKKKGGGVLVFQRSST